MNKRHPFAPLDDVIVVDIVWLNQREKQLKWLDGCIR